MKLIQFEDVSLFYQQVKDYLLQDQARHHLMLGIIHTLIHTPQRFNTKPFLAIVEDQGSIIAVALRTPPYKLLLSKVADFDPKEGVQTSQSGVNPKSKIQNPKSNDAIDVIAHHLRIHTDVLPGVSSLVEEAKHFAQTWHCLTHQSYQVDMELQIHQLSEVKPLSYPSGFLRLATSSERDLLIAWHNNFIEETMPTTPVDSENIIDHHLNQNSIYLWQDQVPVSMAFANNFLAQFARIGPVYTPSPYRCKGYATACVATLSQRLLNQGCSTCYLYTDLESPTPNHIYKIIGYEPVCNWHDYGFY